MSPSLPRLFPIGIAVMITTAAGLAGCVGSGDISDVTGGKVTQMITVEGADPIEQEIRVFPTVGGQSLAGAPMTLPADFKGAPVLVTVAFELAHKDTLDSWLMLYRDMAKAFPDLHYYQVPVAAGQDDWYRFYLNNGLRLNVWDGKLREHTVVVHTDLTAFLERADMPDVNEPYALLLDDTGHELWRRRGAATPLTRTELEQALAPPDTDLPPPATE